MNMNDWKNIYEEKPEFGQTVIALGNYDGELHGVKPGPFIGMGAWKGIGIVEMPSDGYHAHIINVVLWMPAPEVQDEQAKARLKRRKDLLCVVTCPKVQPRGLCSDLGWINANVEAVMWFLEAMSK